MSVLGHILEAADRDDSKGKRLLIESTLSTICKKLVLGGFNDTMEKLCAQIIFSYFESVAVSNQIKYIQLALRCLLQLLRRKDGHVLLSVFVGLGITKFAKSAADSFRSVLATLSENDRLFLQNTMRNAVLMQSSISMQDTTDSAANMKIDIARYSKGGPK